MPKNKKILYVPFCTISGNMESYTSADYPEVEGHMRWEENRVFTMDMEIEMYSRGRSSAVWWLKGSDGKQYYMFMTDMLDLMKNNEIKRGVVSGTWTFQKRGCNYGIRLAKTDETEN